MPDPNVPARSIAQALTPATESDRRGCVLVTGAAGFIGSHVSEALLARGHSVVGVDNFDPYYNPALKRGYVREIAGSGDADSRFELVESDICDAHAMRRVFERVRPVGVIHLAARAGVRPSIADPAAYAHTNVFGTQVLLDEARRVSCSRFVMASSSSVYGNNPRTPFSEDDDVSNPISPYAATKRACELIAHSHWHLTKMPTACLRFFTVFGPRQRPDLAIAMFLRKIAMGETIQLFGDGSSSRDYTFVDDVVRGVLASYDRIPEHGYRIWNLGNSTPVSLSDMVGTIAKVVGKEPVIKREAMQPGDVERTFADLSRSGRELGYGPRTSFAEGVSKQWAYLRERL
jgi:UDP-glucuronate 4-epimerase